MLHEPNCRKRGCVHYLSVRRLGKEESSERVTCKAFRRGIPNAIAYGRRKHTQPFPGDGGVQFEKEA